MKRAVLFLHGNKPSSAIIKKYIKQSDTIICADGGAEYVVAFGLIPNVIIGDNDSLSSSIQKKLRHKSIQWITYPTDKDKTDSELTIEYAIEQNFDQLLIFCAVGDRLDHFLSNITIFVNFAKKIKMIIFTEEQIGYFVTDSVHLSGNKGDIISLIPLQKNVQGVMTTGLQYTLDNETLFFGKSRGVSNVVTGKNVVISIKSGVLLVLQQNSKNLPKYLSMELK